jgi:hypothetical protein
MRIVRYGVLLSIHFFSFVFIFIILMNFIMFAVQNHIFLSIIWLIGFVFSFWLSHRVSKRMVFRGLPWGESFINSIKSISID